MFEAYYRPPGSFVMAGPRPTTPGKTQKPGQPGQPPTFTLGGAVGGNPGSGMPPVTTSWPGTYPTGSSSSTITYDPDTYGDWQDYGIG